MKKFLLILSSIIIFLAIFFSFNAYSESIDTIDEKKELLITNKVIKSLPLKYNFVGVNWFDYCTLNSAFLNDPKQLYELGASLKKYNIDMIRYPGGMNVLAYQWNISNDQKLSSLRDLPKYEQSYMTSRSISPDDEMNYPTFIRFIKQHYLKATIQVNIHNYYDKNKITENISMLKKYKYTSTGSRIKETGVVDWDLVHLAAQNAAAQVLWTKMNRALPNVIFWEMGNEDYLGNMFLNSGYTGKEYAKVCSIFMGEMLKVDPDLKFILTSVTYPPGHTEINQWITNSLNNWTYDVLSSNDLSPYKKNIYAVTRHFYGFNNIKQATSWADFQSNNLNDNMIYRDKMLDNHKKVMEKYGYTNQQIFVNEFNVNNFMNKYMHTWLSALSLAKLMLIVANNPYATHMDYHNLLHQWGGIDCGFGFFNYAKNFYGTKFLPYPAASVISFINENYKGEILETSSNIDNMYITASKTANEINVIIVNRGDTSKVDLKLKGLSEYRYKDNLVLGSGLSYSFESFPDGATRENPSEVRIITPTSENLNVIKNGEYLNLKIPARSIVSLRLKNI